jgi:hypothetical protein
MLTKADASSYLIKAMAAIIPSMNTQPLRLLLCGYGLSTAMGVGAFAYGAGVIASMLVFWLGGAVITLALAIAPPTRRMFSASEAADQDGEALAEAIRRWEADRFGDTAETQERPRRSADQ